MVRWPRSPWLAAFPPPPPPPVARARSAASQVLRGHPTSHGRASRAYRQSVPLTARHPPACHPANPKGRGITARHGRPRGLPVLSMKSFVHAQVLRPRGVPQQLAITPPAAWPSANAQASAPRMSVTFTRLNSPACTTPTDASPPPSRTADARLGADERIATPSIVEQLASPSLCRLSGAFVSLQTLAQARRLTPDWRGGTMIAVGRIALVSALVLFWMAAALPGTAASGVPRTGYSPAWSS